MEKYNKFPKNVKKTIRYINQDAPFEQLIYLKEYINAAINKREIKLQEKRKKI
ncbi:hypothetical protein ABE088_15175 [Priestia megaterium]